MTYKLHPSLECYFSQPCLAQFDLFMLIVIKDYWHYFRTLGTVGKTIVSSEFCIYILNILLYIVDWQNLHAYIILYICETIKLEL